MLGDPNEMTSPARFVILVPEGLDSVAAELERAVCRDDVVVVCERRRGDRRDSTIGRRRDTLAALRERRRIVHVGGRRVSERRATAIPWRDGIGLLPPRFRGIATRLAFLARRPPSARKREQDHAVRLALRHQGGDPNAFALLYLRYFQRVYRYLQTGVDHSRAEELAQEVFLRAFERLDGLTLADGRLESWFFQVARNLMIDELRKARRSITHDPADLVEHVDGRHPRDPDDSPTHALTGLERLPSTYGQVLFLRYVADLSWADIARAMDRSPGAVRMLHHRALAALRDELKVHEDGDDETLCSSHDMRAPRGWLVLEVWAA